MAEDKLDQVAQQYALCKESFNTLEQDTHLGGIRENWQTGVNNFRRLYLNDPRGYKASSCLFMMARMSHRMYKRFHQSSDLEEALVYFNDVTTLFPHDSLADDALFNTAEITLLDKNDRERAGALYRQVVSAYPSGDRIVQAQERLRQLQQETDAASPPALAESILSTGPLTTIMSPKHWASDEYTRIVIPASAPVHYSNSLLEKHGDQPRRLYVDFANSRIDAQSQVPLPIEDGLLKQVRSGQFNPTTVRVVLDIESISNYKIFNLNDPFRVIIDVHGEKRKRPLKADLEDSSLPTAPPASEEKNDRHDSSPPKAAITKSLNDTDDTFITLRDTKKKPVQAVSQAGTPVDTISVSPGDRKISLAQQLGLGVKRIVIDPGHGGKDPGAMAFGLKEKDIVLNVAKKVARILKEEHQFDTRLTRSKDTFLPLEERTAIANTEKADLFVSIHVNAHPEQQVRGVETFYLNLATNAEAMRVAALENATSTHNISDLQDILADLMQNSKIQESSLLAEFVQRNMISGLKKKRYETKNLGVKQAPFYVLLGAQMPAILAEIAFITNPEEAELLRNDGYLEILAREIAAGIIQYSTHYAKAATKGATSKH